MRGLSLALVLSALGALPAAAPATDCESLRRLILERIAATRGTDETDDPRIREALGQIARLRSSAADRARAASAALGSPDAGIRHAAVLTLGEIGGDAARGLLVAALDDSEAFVVAGALEGLARSAAEDVVERARALARDPRDIVRSAAARILVRLEAATDAPVDAAEVNALRILDAARRGDTGRVRASLHPVRRIEVVEEDRVEGFLRSSATPVVVSREVLPTLRRAQASIDSLRCGPPDRSGETVCAVTDRVGYSTELHFARLLDRLYLYRVRHHGGVPAI